MSEWLDGFSMAWGMFLAIPCPLRRWNEKAREKMLVCLPLVGLAVGGIWLGLYLLLRHAAIGGLYAFLMAALPWLVTGFMHLDGYMDVCDAVLSRRELATRQRILKDSHCGAFAVIGMVLLALCQWSVFLSGSADESLWGLLLIPVATRACAGLAVLKLRPMGTSQYATMGRHGGYAAALAVLLVVVCVRRGQTAAQPEPTPRTSAAVRKDAAQTLLDGMTTREKICQLLIVHPEVLTGGGTVTSMTDDLAAALRDYPVGGFLLSAGNMTSGEQLAALTSALSAADATAPLVTVDEEGGRVARLMNTVGTTKLNSMYSYRSLGTQGAYDNAQTLAHDIAAYGFNTDFAPVADVWTNKRSNAIGDRAYSDDYDEAATLVAAAVSGFRDAGVICCLKHFPGHGSTAADSHNGAATVDKTLPQLRQEDLKPFVSGIAAGADMVMVGHLTVPTMDDVPASLSHKIVTNLLRYDLGFRGVIVTDGLQMQALAQYTDGEKAVLALAAGNDMLLEIGDVPGAVAAVEQALADGTLTQAALDASALRVLQLKLAHGIVPLPEAG